MKRRLFAIVCALVIVNVTLWAQSGYCGDPNVNGGMDVKWTVADGVLTISGVGAMADYSNKGASWSSYDFEKVEISEGVTSIGKCALSHCTSLASITIPSSVTSIGDWAFSKCYALTDIALPHSVTSIGDKAFSKCTTLTVIDIPHSVTSIGNSVFSECASLTNITIPNSVTSIGDYAFEACFALTDLTLPHSVTSIGKNAFSYAGLTSIIIPHSVTSIGDEAFSHCSSLSTITCLNPIPPVLGGLAFYRINERGFLHVPDVDAYKASDWAQYFSSIEQIAPTTVPDVVTENTTPTSIYDLSGRRVTAPVGGHIYIVNGKSTVW